jgi:hypothetical protein
VPNFSETFAEHEVFMRAVTHQTAATADDMQMLLINSRRLINESRKVLARAGAVLEKDRRFWQVER